LADEPERKPSVELAVDSQCLHPGNAESGTLEIRSQAGDALMALQVSDAIDHLKTALATVDGLVADASTDPSSEHVLYQLGEASHVMHYASLVLSDCTESRATSEADL